MFVVAVKVNAAECIDDCLAQIGDTKYDSLLEAVNAVPTTGEETTIKILKDASNIPGFALDANANKNFIIDFDGHTVQLGVPLVGSTGTVTINIQLKKGSTVTLKNGVLKSAKEAKMLIQNYSNLTLENMTIDATTADYDKMYALSNNNGVVNIIGKTNIYSNYVAFDAYFWPKMSYTEGTQVTVDTEGTIRGTIELLTDGSDITSKTTLTIKNINHEGELIVEEGLENNLIIIESEEEDALKYYEIVDATGEKTYVMAKESELVSEVEIEEVDEKDIDPDMLEEVKSQVDSKYTFASYLDINLGRYTKNGDFLGYVSEPEDEVSITINIPKTLDEVKEGFVRKYVIVRVHDDKVELITDVKDNGDGTVTFKSGKFSAYALAYEDELKKEEPKEDQNSKQEETNIESEIESPNTVDNVMLYVLFGLVALIGFVVAAKKFKKNIN